MLDAESVDLSDGELDMLALDGFFDQRNLRHLRLVMGTDIVQARRVGQTRLTRSGSTSQGGKTGAGKKQGPASADPTFQCS